MKTITYDETKWKLMPVQATDKMLCAALASRGSLWIGQATAKIFGPVYRAFIDSSPAEPSAPEATDDQDEIRRTFAALEGARFDVFEQGWNAGKADLMRQYHLHDKNAATRADMQTGENNG